MMALKIKENRHLILLILLILLGTFLRFYHLDYNSLWLDEAYTLFAANHTLSGIWDLVSTSDFTPPLFYWIEHFMLVFGQSEFVLRFIPALLGVLTIPVFYSIGKEFADKDVGIIMAALLTFSPFHVYLSQEARAYSAMLFLFSLALFFFLLSLHTNRVYSWILFGFLSALTLWTHYYTLIPLALLFVYALFWGISRARKGLQQPHVYALSFLTFILVCLPLVPLTIDLYLQRTGTPPLFGYKGLEIISRIFLSLSEYHRTLMALFLVLFVIGIFSLWKKDRAKALLIVGLLTVPALISIYLAERMPMDERYLFYLLPFFFLGISLSFKPLAGLFKGKILGKNLIIILIVIFFLIQAPFLALYYNAYFTQYSKEDWRGIAQSIEENSAEGDFIFVIPYYTQLPLDIYYSNKSDGTYEFGVRNESEILPLLPRLKNNQAYFVVTEHINAVDPDGSTIQWLHNNTQRVGVTRDIELYSLNLSKSS
jgi:4-amino-4-deoxy-L-arabinose transferase-like glycosyltransferase